MTPPRLRYVDAPAHIALLGALWAGYTAVRALASNSNGAAFSNAARLLEIQSALGLNIERTVQSAISTPAVFVGSNTYYLLHFPLTLAVLALTFWRHRNSVFPIFRNSVIGSTAAALMVHVMVPMAPPRMLPAFIDATLIYGPDPYAIPGSGAVNQYAAMPSMHVGWAILTGYAIWKFSSRPILKGAAILHPVLTALVVIITGHHFVADAFVGAGLAATFLILSISPQWSSRNRPLPLSKISGKGAGRRLAEQASQDCVHIGHLRFSQRRAESGFDVAGVHDRHALVAAENGAEVLIWTTGGLG